MDLCLNLSFGAYFLATVLYFISVFFRNKIVSFFPRLFIIAVIHGLTLYIIMRWSIAGRPPFSNMFESLVVFSWAISLGVIFIDVKYRIAIVTAFSALLGLIVLGSASLLDSTVAPLMPALKSNWLTIHVLTCLIGYAALAIAFVTSITVLVKKDIAVVDLLSYKLIAFGFLFLTLGIITGSVWANSAWGTYWSWDPKETWSLITWFIYAAYLHVRYTKGWQGTKAAWFSVVGFLSVLFTYFGVNYLLSGLHSYSG